MPISPLLQRSTPLGGASQAAPTRRDSFGFGGRVSVKRRGTLDQRLLDQFSKLAEDGIFGKGGINRIIGEQRSAGFRNAQRLSGGLRRKLGRRLGSRSGALQGEVLNRVFAPLLGQLATQRGQLTQANLQSRLAGLQGGLNVFNAQTGRMGAENQQQDGGGLLDILSAIAPVAGFAFGGPPGAAAGAAVGGAAGGVAGRRRGGVVRGSQRFPETDSIPTI